MRRALFYPGAILVLIGILLLALSTRSTSAASSGTGRTQSYNLKVDPFLYKSFNFTVGANASVVVSIDTQFGEGAGIEALSKGAGCIDLYIMDPANYQRWLDNESTSTYLTANGAHTSSFMFQAGSDGTYYAILNNAGRCTEKTVHLEFKESYVPILGQQYQVAGLGSLSLGALLAIYGFTKEKAPAPEPGQKADEQGDVALQENGI